MGDNWLQRAFHIILLALLAYGLWAIRLVFVVNFMTWFWFWMFVVTCGLCWLRHRRPK